MNTKTSPTFDIPCALVLGLVLLLAPFIGGGGGVIGDGTLAILALAAGIVLVWSRGSARPVAFRPFAAFVAILALSSVVTASIHATIADTLYFAGCAAAAIVASSVLRSEKSLSVAISTLAGIGFALGVFAAVEYHSQGGSWRVFTTFQSPGFFGGYLTLLIPVTFAALLGARSRMWAVLFALSLALQAHSLLLTGTRVALAASALGVVVLLALGLWQRAVKKEQVLRFVIALVLVAGAAYLAKAPTEARISGPAAQAQAHSGSFRIATWKGTASIIKANPILGTGAGTFDLVFPKYRIAGPTKMAHDSYLQIASDSGVFALLALAAAFVGLITGGFRSFRGSASPLLTCGIIGALAAALVRNTLDSDIYNAAIGFTFWILAGLAAAQSANSRVLLLKPWSKYLITVVLLGMIALQYSFVLGQSRYDSAESAMRDGRWDAAVSLYSSAAAVDPLRADHQLRLGQLLAASSDGDREMLDTGLGHIRRAIELEPTRAKHQISLGRILVDKGDVSRAVDAYRQALVVDPHATPAMLALARLLKGKSSDEMYARLVTEESSPAETLKGVPEAVNPDFAWARYYFGEKYLREGDKSAAARQFKLAIERLERRKSYQTYVTAMQSVGLLDPADEATLDKLLSDCKSGLKAADNSRHILPEGR